MNERGRRCSILTRRWSRASYNVTDAGIVSQLWVSRLRADHQAIQSPDDRPWAVKLRVAKQFLRLLRCVNIYAFHYTGVHPVPAVEHCIFYSVFGTQTPSFSLSLSLSLSLSKELKRFISPFIKPCRKWRTGFERSVRRHRRSRRRSVAKLSCFDLFAKTPFTLTHCIIASGRDCVYLFCLLFVFCSPGLEGARARENDENRTRALWSHRLLQIGSLWWRE